METTQQKVSNSYPTIFHSNSKQCCPFRSVPAGTDGTPRTSNKNEAKRCSFCTSFYSGPYRKFRPNSGRNAPVLYRPSRSGVSIKRRRLHLNENDVVQGVNKPPKPISISHFPFPRFLKSLNLFPQFPDFFLPKSLP